MRLCSATDDSSTPDRRSVARQEIAAGARRSNGLRTVRQPARSSTLDARMGFRFRDAPFDYFSRWWETREPPIGPVVGPSAFLIGDAQIG